LGKKCSKSFEKSLYQTEEINQSGLFEYAQWMKKVEEAIKLAIIRNSRKSVLPIEMDSY
jgi:hypothetical protein